MTLAKTPRGLWTVIFNLDVKALMGSSIGQQCNGDIVNFWDKILTLSTKTEFTSLGVRTQGWPVQLCHVQKCLAEGTRVPNPVHSLLTELCPGTGLHQCRRKHAFWKDVHPGVLLCKQRKGRTCGSLRKCQPSSPSSYLLSSVLLELYPLKWAWGRKGTMFHPHLKLERIKFCLRRPLRVRERRSYTNAGKFHPPC